MFSSTLSTCGILNSIPCNLALPELKHIEKYLIFISWLHNDPRDKIGAFKRMHTKIIRSIIGPKFWKTVRDTLVSLNIIEIEWSYQKGDYSMGYRLTQEYRGQESIPYSFSDKIINRMKHYLNYFVEDKSLQHNNNNYYNKKSVRTHSYELLSSVSSNSSREPKAQAPAAISLNESQLTYNNVVILKPKYQNWVIRCVNKITNVLTDYSEMDYILNKLIKQATHEQNIVYHKVDRSTIQGIKDYMNLKYGINKLRT